jgi:hypothetical protein
MMDRSTKKFLDKNPHYKNLKALARLLVTYSSDKVLGKLTQKKPAAMWRYRAIVGAGLAVS